MIKDIRREFFSKSDSVTNDEIGQYLCLDWSPESINERLSIELAEDKQLFTVQSIDVLKKIDCKVDSFSEGYRGLVKPDGKAQLGEREL